MTGGLRIVAFNVFYPAYQLVADWAARHGHRIVLLVTVPVSDPLRYGGELSNIVAAVPPEQDVLVTGRMRKTAAPAIAALAPDLIVSGTFPLRIPPEVTEIPRFGAVNLHPAPLPRGRGPNPQRLIYEGDLTTGATLHRIAPGFDTGAILSKKECRLSESVTSAELLGVWFELLTAALEEGTARVVAGEPGETQDESLATYVAPFTPEERVLNWDEPALTIQRRAAALNLVGTTARGRIDGWEVLVRDVRALADAPPAAAGAILDRAGDVITVRVGDSAVQVTAAQ